MLSVPLRLRRITNPASTHVTLLSFTTGLSVGVIPGMEDLPGTVVGLARAGQMTGAIVHAGTLNSIFARGPDLPCGTIVDLFGGTLVTPRPDRRELICSLEHAVRVGADAVLATINHGGPDEAHRLRLCGQLTRECASWGMPFLLRILTSETDAQRQYSAAMCGSGARMAYELGADMVVVNYPGSLEAFAEAIAGLAIPVVIGGAPRLDTDERLLESVAQAMRGGASGVAMNATIFWQDAPTATLAHMNRIIHG